ncbi:short-chain dehydrogenase [Chromatiales bacterium (ex Bugula neritina AB1)]|nr:short-chain dehydrogenase [Chromatiales bacterium (ex Bugula neritina AB1)]
MNVSGKTVVVTGGARGIGKALAERFAAEGARVLVADILLAEAEQVALDIGGRAMRCDVTREADIVALVEFAEQRFGPIDLFCSNAGLFRGEPTHSASASNEDWQLCWDVHVMSHVYAARAVLPGMNERGEGYLLNMASAAGLLSQIGDAAYSTTKHAAVGFAEALNINHRDDGIRVSVICPQFVATPMLGYDGQETEQVPGVISSAQLAEAVMQGVKSEIFLILPHQEVAGYLQFKAGDYDRWLGGMRKLRRRIIDKLGSVKLLEMHKHI